MKNVGLQNSYSLSVVCITSCDHTLQKLHWWNPHICYLIMDAVLMFRLQRSAIVAQLLLVSSSLKGNYTPQISESLLDVIVENWHLPLIVLNYKMSSCHTFIKIWSTYLLCGLVLVQLTNAKVEVNYTIKSSFSFGLRVPSLTNPPLFIYFKA